MNQKLFKETFTILNQGSKVDDQSIIEINKKTPGLYGNLPY